MQEKLGCSFQFLEANQTSLNGGKEKECTIKDVKQKKSIQDVVYGKIHLIHFCFNVETTVLFMVKDFPNIQLAVRSGGSLRC